jgi:Uma2 family endonuclease
MAMYAAQITREPDPLNVRRRGPFTYDDFCALVPDGQKGDLIDGVIYVASPENIEANNLLTWLMTVLSLIVDENDLGVIHCSRVACRLDKDNAPEPDLLFLKKSHLHRRKRSEIRGPADLAIEIVSPESVWRDYTKKKELYERFKFPEYWIIDEDLKQVTHLVLGRRRRYREERFTEGVLQSYVLPEFWVRIEWLWAETRPRIIDAIREIMASQ